MFKDSVCCFYLNWGEFDPRRCPTKINGAVKEILSGKMGRTELQSFQGNRAGIQKELVEADFAIVIPLRVLMQECISE